MGVVMNKTRKYFKHTALINRVRTSIKGNSFQQNTKRISVLDCIMSSLAMFGLKYTSLLQFEEDKKAEPQMIQNIKSSYEINKVPSDTYLRERLDNKDLSIIMPAFSGIINLLQRSKVLENWKFLDGKYLVSIDGTGFFSSNKIHCKNCCTKIFNKGTEKEKVQYNHQMVVGSVVSPNMKQVLPIAFEPITKEDGSTKNDCEINAGKRLLTQLRKYHPQLPVIILGDDLYSNAPFIKELVAKRCSYILVAKESDHQSLYDYIEHADKEDCIEYEFTTNTVERKYRFMQNVPLNDSNQDIKVNVLCLEERDLKASKISKWGWVTNLIIETINVNNIMKGGRTRWKSENEGFNTLKNQGYHFEHNYGHGNNGLSNLLAAITLLAFLLDQVLEIANMEFMGVLKKYVSRYNSFDKIRAIFVLHIVVNFDEACNHLAQPPPSEN